MKTMSNPAISLSTASELIAGLYRRHNPVLLRFLTRRTRCTQRAQDVAQAAWLKLLSALGRGACGARGESELRAYLFEVAHNTWLDEYTRKHAESRTRSFDPGDMERISEGEVPGPDEQMQQAQVAQLLGRAVSSLPREQEQVIRMWARGESIRAMSQASAAPTDTVLSRKKYALAHMRSALAAAEL